MKKVLCFSAVLIFCFSASCWSAPILTADDFSPIVQANTEQERQKLSTVKTPEGVKTEVDPTLKKPVTTASTAQDAVNSVMQRFYADGGEGCESIRLPDGELGLVAVGVGTYGSDMKNIVAQRREQQLAYYIAFLQAKRLMSRYFEGASIEQLSMFIHEESSTDNANESTSATTDKSTLNIKSATSAVLKGYVPYDVRDDFENGTVYLTLVSTPRTQGRYSRPTSTTQIAETQNEGINKILAEIQSGVVPSIGGRIVNVPETGEIAFVGFGSEVVRPANNRKAKADNQTTARRRASLRAEASLCGIIRGDTVTTSDSDEVVANNSYTSGGKNIDLSDPIDDLSSDSEKAEAQETAQGFCSDDSYKPVIQSAIKGIILPGVSPMKSEEILPQYQFHRTRASRMSKSILRSIKTPALLSLVFPGLLTSRFNRMRNLSLRRRLYFMGLAPFLLIAFVSAAFGISSYNAAISFLEESHHSLSDEAKRVLLSCASNDRNSTGWTAEISSEDTVYAVETVPILKAQTKSAQNSNKNSAMRRSLSRATLRLAVYLDNGKLDRKRFSN